MAGSIASGLQLSGLATGIDTTSIINGLTSINQKRIDQLNNRKAGFVQQQTTLDGLQAKLLDFQGSLGTLSRSVNGAFDGRLATLSDTTFADVAASSSAQAGTYSVTVNKLAQAAQIASQGFSDPSTNIHTGTLTLQVGSGSATTVTINSTNNTLQGLVSAVNNSGGDVKASIVKDGSATPYRVLLTSTKTGAANTIQITNNLTGGTGAAINLTQTVQAASDAQVVLGTGTGAITANSASNSVSDLITGVTLNLKQADPTKTLSLSVTNDTTSAKKAVTGLVDSFNAVVDYISQNDQYNATTKSAGVLLGNSDVSGLEQQLRDTLTQSVAGTNPNAANLAAVGITFNDNGKLQVDDAKLTSALNGQTTGVTLDDVRKLFSVSGTSTNPGVTFLTASDQTQPTTPSQPVQVTLTRAAARASITGISALAGTVTITAQNNTFAIKLNGIASRLIALSPGNYTPASLAAAIQADINADTQLGNNDVTVDLDAGRLRIASQAFGSAANISFLPGGTALGAGGPLGFTGTEGASGSDVLGSFTVNGKTETATGIGQILSGNTSNATTSGLQLKVTLGSGDIPASGPAASVTVTQGVAAKLNTLLNKYVDPVSGRFKAVDDGFKQNIADIDKTVAKQNTELEDKKNQLIQQFADMEAAVSKLKNLGDQITAQLGGTKLTG